MRESNQDVKQTSLTSPLLNPGHWYTDSEINRLLNCQLKDGEQAHIYAAQYPFLHSTTISQATTGIFQAILKQCLTSAIPSIIPVNCLEQAEVDDNGLPTSQVQIGSHWFLVVVEPKEEQVYQLTVIDSYGNGLERNIDITQKNLLELQDMVESHHPSYSFWIRISRLMGTIDGLLRKEKLPIRLETTVTGVVQQQDGVNCGPLLVQNSIDWLQQAALNIYQPQDLRQQHANLLPVEQQSAAIGDNVVMQESSANHNLMTSQIFTQKQTTHRQINQVPPDLSTNKDSTMNELASISSAVGLLSQRQTLIASDWSDHPLLRSIYQNEPQRLEIIERLDTQELYKTDGHQNTGQHVAALLGDEATLIAYSNKNLLNDDKNSFGMTPFHAAILNGAPSIIEHWLNYRTKSAEIPLVLSNYQGIKDFSLSPLNLAIFMGHTEVVKAIYHLLAQKHSINNRLVWQSSLGTPLHVAVVSRYGDTLQFLLSDNRLRDWMKGFLEEQNEQQETPLAYAARLGNTEAIRVLVEKGADINSQNNRHNRTALHYAVLGRKPAAVESLIRLNADCRLTSEEESDRGNKKRTAGNLADSLLRKDRRNGDLKTISSQLDNIDEIKKRAHGNLPTSHITYRNAVIQGGGAKGLAYIGVLEVLERENKLAQLHRVAGTSAGAISALLVALNFSSIEVKQALLTLSVENMLGQSESALFDKLQRAKIDIAQWFDEMRQEQHQGAWGKTNRAFNGLYHQGPHVYTLFTLLKKLTGETALSDGKALASWLKNLVAQKLANDFREHGKDYDNHYQTNLTFKRLQDLVKDNLGYKHLHVFTTDITKQEVVVFNSEEKRWQDVNVIEAVCASAALPFVFTPREISYPSLADPQKQETSLFVDGGLLRNRPIEYFDKLLYQDAFVDDQWRFQERTNQETLGLFLDAGKPLDNLAEAINSCQEAVKNDSLNIGKLIYRMGTFFYNAEQILQRLRGDIEPRRILINVYPIETTDFDIVKEDEKLAELIDKGRKATEDFLHPQPRQGVYTQPQRYTHFQPQMQGIPQQPVEIREDDSLQPSASTNNPNFQ